MIKNKIPLVDDLHDNLICTSCLLPMQYQTKIQDCFIWQCFKCGKKYFICQSNNAYDIEESWSDSR